MFYASQIKFTEKLITEASQATDTINEINMNWESNIYTPVKTNRYRRDPYRSEASAEMK